MTTAPLSCAAGTIGLSAGGFGMLPNSNCHGSSGSVLAAGGLGGGRIAGVVVRHRKAHSKRARTATFRMRSLRWTPAQPTVNRFVLMQRDENFFGNPL